MILRRKFCYILLVACFCRVVSFAQQRNEIDVVRYSKESRLSNGTCLKVLEFLRTNQSADSIAVRIFKEEYKIDNMSYHQQESLFTKDYKEVIYYFSRQGNDRYLCRLKTFMGLDHVLLVK